jgi:hypothetical protein
LQNSNQPIGARAVSPVEANSGFSLAALALVGVAKTAAAESAMQQADSRIRLRRPAIFAAPFPRCWDKVSHKDFAAPLSLVWHFEVKPSQSIDEY